MNRPFSMILMAFALVACGGDGASDASPGKAATPSAAAPKASAPAAARQLTLTYFTMTG